MGLASAGECRSDAGLGKKSQNLGFHQSHSCAIAYTAQETVAMAFTGSDHPAGVLLSQHSSVFSHPYVLVQSKIS